jgi:hypothetical protein
MLLVPDDLAEVIDAAAEDGIHIHNDLCSVFTARVGDDQSCSCGVPGLLRKLQDAVKAAGPVAVRQAA